MKKTTKTEYFYNEDEHICRSVTTETADCCDCEDGNLITSGIEMVDNGDAMATTALILATVSLCIVAISSIFRRN